MYTPVWKRFRDTERAPSKQGNASIEKADHGGTQEMSVANLDKTLYPGEKFTKAKVIDYYIRILKYLLPHLKDRPVTLKRFPDGIYVTHRPDSPRCDKPQKEKQTAHNALQEAIEVAHQAASLNRAGIAALTLIEEIRDLAVDMVSSAYERAAATFHNKLLRSERPPPYKRRMLGAK